MSSTSANFKTNGIHPERQRAKENKTVPPDFPIIVHSHLSWDWVWQRPQQFLSRLSKSHRVLFIETHAPNPNLVNPHVEFRVAENFPNVTILKIQFPERRWHDGNYVDETRRELVKAALRGPFD